MKCRSIGVVEPVARIERKEFNLSTFGQVGWLVYHESAGRHTGLAPSVPAHKRHRIAVRGRSGRDTRYGGA
jgi:hypothetical protein